MSAAVMTENPLIGIEGSLLWLIEFIRGQAGMRNGTYLGPVSRN